MTFYAELAGEWRQAKDETSRQKRPSPNWVSTAEREREEW